MLSCNFDYDFNKEKDGLINIPGYPDEKKDFATPQSGEEKFIRIERKDEDICALYFDETTADSILSTGQLLLYKHSTTTGTSGAPLLLLNKKSTPNNPKYSVIGVHVA